MKPISLRLPPDMAAEVDQFCADNKIKRSAFINHCIAEKLATAKTTITGFSLTLPLPPIDPARMTIAFYPSDHTLDYGDYIPALGCWIPAVWSEYFSDLASVKKRPVSGVINERLRKYMSADDVIRYAETKGWPLSYARRHLLNHVFPELPVCDFGKPPPRRTFARRPNRGA